MSAHRLHLAAAAAVLFLAPAPAAAEPAATFDRTLVREPAATSPRDVAFAADGTAFVTDDEGDRLVRVAPDGTARAIVTAADTFDAPHGVALEAGRHVVVAERGHSYVGRFTFDGAKVGVFAGAVGGEIIKPIDVAAVPDGLLVVEQTRLLRYRGGPDDALDEAERWSVVREGFGSLDAVVATGGGRAAVIEGSDRTLKLVALDGGALLDSVGGDGIEPDQFRFASGLSMRENGDLLVADTFNDRIKVFPAQAGRERFAASYILSTEGMYRPGCVVPVPGGDAERFATCTGVLDYPYTAGERRVDLWSFGPRPQAPSQPAPAQPAAPQQPAATPERRAPAASPWRCSRGLIAVCRRSGSPVLRVVTRGRARVRVIERGVVRRARAASDGVALVRMPRRFRAVRVRVVTVRTAGATVRVRLR